MKFTKSNIPLYLCAKYKILEIAITAKQRVGTWQFYVLFFKQIMRSWLENKKLFGELISGVFSFSDVWWLSLQDRVL